MAQYIITLTDAEDKALQHVAFSVQEWIENFVKLRAQSAINEIVSSEVSRKLEMGETISGTKDEIVMASQIETAAERTARIEAEIAARNTEAAE